MFKDIDVTLFAGNTAQIGNALLTSGDHIRFLNLNKNADREFFNEIFEEICEALRGNPVIKTLDFSRSKIGNDGAVLLATALKENHAIDTINLSNNDIQDVGAAALAETLKVNKVIHTLDLSGNPGASEAIAISSKTSESIEATLLAYAGIAAGKAIASPFIHYLNDQLNDQNQEKSLLNYSAEQFTLTNAVKSAVFSAAFYALPNQTSTIHKVSIANIISDAVQLSAEYATSALFQAAVSWYMAGTDKQSQSAVYQDHPFATGILVSTAGDLMKLSYDAAHVCYDLIMGKDNSTAIEGEL